MLNGRMRGGTGGSVNQQLTLAQGSSPFACNCMKTPPLILFLAMLGSSPGVAPAGEKAPDGKTFFTRLGPETTGLTHVNRMDVNHPRNYLYHSGMTCGGVAVADFDGDGKVDIFLGGTTGPNRLYRQSGDLKFTDITASCGEGLDGGDRWTTGAAVADVNNDGRPDIYLCNYMQPNELWLNLGPGKSGAPVTFRECAKAAGLDAVDCSHSAAFADYDGDGKLDIYLLTNRIEDPQGSPGKLPVMPGSGEGGRLPELLPEAERYYQMWRWDASNWGSEPIGTPDYLFRQTGVTADGTPKFENTTKQAGISGKGDGLSVTWWDPDADGDPDIYVGNDFIAGDKWYRNNGDGSFTDILRESVPHTPWFSMGADFGDVNNDGRLDLLVADMSATSHYKSKTTMGIMGGVTLKRSFFDTPPQYMRNALYINTGGNRFVEGAYLWKVSSTDWTWAVKFADFDIDGWQDLYFTNGISRHMNDSDLKITEDQLVGKHMFDYFKSGEMRKEKHRSYRNEHGEKFTETSDAWGLGHEGVSYGAAYADFDRDGDLDLVTVNLEEPDSIYRNDTKGHWLEVKLRGHEANRDGFGARVTVKTRAGNQVRYLSPQTGYLSSNEPLLHFGLGAETEAEITVHWPFGAVQQGPRVKAGQVVTIEQKGGVPFSREPQQEGIFKKLETLSAARHRDAGWEGDFQKPLQSLLPWALSQLGPAVACADVDGDGDGDFYTGAAADQTGELRINQGGGKFAPRYVADFAKDKAAEDQGAVFADVDGDGDADLFVASGSNEFSAGAKELQDRLYLNDGKGAFIAAPAGSLPPDALCGSCAVAADLDSDGDNDLFVGTRVKPGKYPESEPSRLLLNDGNGRFTDAPDFHLEALVTGACAADLDGDSRADLLVATEWGPVLYFHQENGGLVDRTDTAGLADLTGFWNSVFPVDADRDGDLDFVAGNLGLNTKYKTPDAEHPHLAYYGDFDGKGAQFVEVKREGDMLYPERGRSCSSRAMPFIADKFKTFKTFAQASLAEIYTPTKLDSSRMMKVTTFATGVFLNDGDRFSFRPLPRLAQIAPAMGLAVADFDADGNADIVLNQNFIFGPQIETGAFDGGIGLMLKGDGQGSFSPVDPAHSGLVIPGDNRAAAVLDLNGDGSPDLLGGQNNGSLQAFHTTGGKWLAVRLPGGLCATVTLQIPGQPPQTAVLSPGGGYWSQNDSAAWFATGQAREGTVTVSSGGRKTETKWDGAAATLTLTKP